MLLLLKSKLFFFCSHCQTNVTHTHTFCLGRMRNTKQRLAFSMWTSFITSSLRTSLKQLQSVQASSGGSEDPPSEELMLAREHIQQYEAQMSQLREKLAEVFHFTGVLLFMSEHEGKKLCSYLFFCFYFSSL
jgi:hypothetical protein